MTPRPDGVDRRVLPRSRYSVLRDALYSMLRFIARHVRGFYGALAAFLTVGVIVGFIAIGIFAVFAAAVEAGLTQPIDEGILDALGRMRNPTIDAIMLEVTSLGNGAVLLMLTAIAAIFLWLTHHHWSVGLLVLAYGGGDILNKILKNFFDRPRPSVLDHLAVTHSPSFPSGHAMNALITYGAIAYLVGRLEPTPLMRRTTWGLAVLLIAGIGFSRSYLGVHYPSDVLAGFLAGLAWLTFVASGVTAIRFFSTRRPEVNVEEEDLNAEIEREVGVRE